MTRCNNCMSIYDNEVELCAKCLTNDYLMDMGESNG
jgi:rRNA maturation endonuclease Nob1